MPNNPTRAAAIAARQAAAATGRERLTWLLAAAWLESNRIATGCANEAAANGSACAEDTGVEDIYPGHTGTGEAGRNGTGVGGDDAKTALQRRFIRAVKNEE